MMENLSGLFAFPTVLGFLGWIALLIGLLSRTLYRHWHEIRRGDVLPDDWGKDGAREWPGDW